jgi:hypothetical protein
MPTINTKAVRDRRVLRFANIQEVYAEIDRCIQAERQGTLRQLGNWPLGTMLGHLAFWASAPYDGYPPMKRPPALLRVLVRLFRRRLIFGKFPAGMRLPGTPAGTFGADPMSTEQGSAKLRAAFDRLHSTAPTTDNPLLGPLTHEEWISFNVRHAELHLSFYKY